jgi:hypothetical protein
MTSPPYAFATRPDERNFQGFQISSAEDKEEVKLVIAVASEVRDKMLAELVATVSSLKAKIDKSKGAAKVILAVFGGLATFVGAILVAIIIGRPAVH